MGGEVPCVPIKDKELVNERRVSNQWMRIGLEWLDLDGGLDM